jgi:hypothetical protein
VRLTRERIEAARAAATPDGTRLALGAWHNPDDGKIEVNVTAVFPPSERARALQFAIDNDQISMADLDAIAREDWPNAIIPTGGTGGQRDEELAQFHLKGTASDHDQQSHAGGGGLDVTTNLGDISEADSRSIRKLLRAIEEAAGGDPIDIDVISSAAKDDYKVMRWDGDKFQPIGVVTPDGTYTPIGPPVYVNATDIVDIDPKVVKMLPDGFLDEMNAIHNAPDRPPEKVTKVVSGKARTKAGHFQAGTPVDADGNPVAKPRRKKGESVTDHMNGWKPGTRWSADRRSRSAAPSVTP